MFEGLRPSSRFSAPVSCGGTVPKHGGLPPPVPPGPHTPRLSALPTTSEAQWR